LTLSNINKGNFHCWCEIDGEIVFDYIFKEYYHFIQKFNLTLEQVRIPYSQQYQAVCRDIVSKSITEYKEDLGILRYLRHLRRLAKKPMFERCWYNALAYQTHINSNAKLIFGKMGWRNKDENPVFLFG